MFKSFLNLTAIFFDAAFDEANKKQNEYSEYEKGQRSILEIDGETVTIQSSTMGSKISSK